MAHVYDHFRTHSGTRRLRDFDYASAGWYFVTICTRGRAMFFGEIRGGVMGLNEIGCLAHGCWAILPHHAPRVRLDAFVVMPNHVHGLLGLMPVEHPVVEHPVAPLHATAASGQARGLISPAAGSLSVVVRSYKSAVTRTVRGAVPGFAWQPRFHDHVVRTEAAFLKIRAYIEQNPATWAHDRLAETLGETIRQPGGSRNPRA